MKRTIFNARALGKPAAPYSHAAIVEAGRLLIIAGQIATDRQGKVVGKGDFKRQFVQVYKNLEAVLKEAGATFSNVVQFTTYLVNSRDVPTFAEVRSQYYKKIFPKGDYPPNTLLIIDRLFMEDLLLEVEAIAALD